MSRFGDTGLRPHGKFDGFSTLEANPQGIFKGSSGCFTDAAYAASDGLVAIIVHDQGKRRSDLFKARKSQIAPQGEEDGFILDDPRTFDRRERDCGAAMPVEQSKADVELLQGSLRSDAGESARQSEGRASAPLNRDSPATHGL